MGSSPQTEIRERVHLEEPKTKAKAFLLNAFDESRSPFFEDELISSLLFFLQNWGVEEEKPEDALFSRDSPSGSQAWANSTAGFWRLCCVHGKHIGPSSMGHSPRSCGGGGGPFPTSKVPMLSALWR